MKIIGIYKIESRIKPERVYIGSAVNINKRWWHHSYRLKNNTHENKRLQNHYNKYGVEDLVYSLLLSCDKDSLLSTEQFFIDSYNPYFNICKIAGSSIGRPSWAKGKKGEWHRTKGCYQKGHVPWMKGKEPWNKGKKGLQKKSPEEREKARQRMIGKKYALKKTRI